MESSSERAARGDPAGILPCDSGYALVILVVVKQGNPSGLGCRGDEKVGMPHRAALLGEKME